METENNLEKESTIPPVVNSTNSAHIDEGVDSNSAAYKILNFFFANTFISMITIVAVSWMFSMLLSFPIFSEIMFNLGIISFAIPIIFWLTVGFVLKIIGFNKASLNIGKALAQLFIFGIVLGIVGFGICVLMISS